MPTYTGISSEAFRHPLDRQAEQALRNLPGFDLIARKFVEFIYERPQLVYLTLFYLSDERIIEAQ